MCKKEQTGCTKRVSFFLLEPVRDEEVEEELHLARGGGGARQRMKAEGGGASGAARALSFARRSERGGLGVPWAWAGAKNRQAGLGR